MAIREQKGDRLLFCDDHEDMPEKKGTIKGNTRVIRDALYIFTFASRKELEKYQI